MTNYQPVEGTGDRNIKVKIRLDFKGVGKPGRFLFGGKPTEKAAEEAREQQVAMFRNVPLQGIHIEDIDMSTEVYTVYDDMNNTEVAFAPVILQISAETLEDIVKFIAREDFRKIEVISPQVLSLQKYEMERLMFRMAEEFKGFRAYLERKYNLR